MPLILNGSTGISGTDGSAATPAVQGTDTNTGMFFPAADQIAFAEGGVEAMRLDASGNVGIGVATPTARLHVNGTSGSAQVRMGTSAGYYEVNAFDGNPVYMVVNGTNHTSGVIGTQSNTPFAFFANNTERARITSAGNFGIGTTSPNNLLDVRGSGVVSTNTGTPNATGWQGLQFDGVNGALNVARNGSNVAAFFHTANAGGIGGPAVGTISINTTSTSYNTSSDYRLKENVTTLTGAAARVQALKPSRFNFIADPSRTVDGFIAHEAAEVVPEAVSGEKDAVNEDGSIKPQGIDQSKLVPLLTAALQEALTEIASLKARVAVLEAN